MGRTHESLYTTPTVILLGLPLYPHSHLYEKWTDQEEGEEDEKRERAKQSKAKQSKKEKQASPSHHHRHRHRHHHHHQQLLQYSKVSPGEINSSMEVARKMSSMIGADFKETELCLGLPGGGGGGGGAAESAAETVKATGKRGFSETVDLKLNLQSKESVVDLNDNVKSPSKEKNLLPCTKDPAKPPTKAQVVGWPPVRSYRKNIMSQKNSGEDGEKGSGSGSGGGAAFVKVCMDGAPYLRKVDLKMYKSYQELSDALGKMFSSFTMGNYGAQGMIDFMNESKLMDLLNSSEYVPTYEDKDGDWMLVGDVPWEMFVDSCKRLRIMKGSEAIGLAPRAMEKCKNRC